MRRALPVLLPCLLLASMPSALPARAGETPPAVALEDLELLPVQEVEWAALMHEHRDLMLRLLFLGHRLERLHEHLASRPDPGDAGGDKLRAWIDRVRERARPLLDELLAHLRDLGVDDEVLGVLDETPRGALRVPRQGLRVVLHVPGLTAAQRRLFERLVPATEGALLAHVALRAKTGADDLADEILALQERFWRVVDATLDREQRAALRRRLPTRLTKVPDLLTELYTLPGLTVSQAARLKSLLVALQQDAAPDQAVVQRVEARLAAGAEPSPAERMRLDREKQDAETRNLTRFLDAWHEARALLTADQRAELAALPPLLAAGERPGDLAAWVRELSPTPDQAGALAAWRRRAGPVKGRMVQELVRAALVERDSGADSPQRETAAFLRAQAWGEALHAARRAAHELLTGVLNHEQIVDWVLGNRP